MPATETRQRLRKDALRTDRIYFSPSGPIPITRKRAEHWIAQFKRMSAAGLAVPVPFEHQDAAVPGNAKFLASKKNFGTLDELTIDDDGQLCFSCTPRPGVVGEARKLPKFVSPQIHDNWVDPSGRVWRDVLTHMALTDVPVNAGQSDKWLVVQDRKGRQIKRMSLSGRWRMANEDEDPPESPESQDSPPDLRDEPAETDDAILSGVNTDDGTDKVFRTVLAGLADTCGLVLPEDTNCENFFERAATALIAVQGHQDAEPQQPADEYDEETNYMGTGVAAMSTTKAPGKTTSPEVTRMSAYELAFTTDRRKQLARRLNDLVDTGRATPDEIRPRLQEASTYRLSLAQDNTLATSAVEAWIESRESLPRGAVWPADERVERMGYESLANPMDDEREDQREQGRTVATAPIQY